MPVVEEPRVLPAEDGSATRGGGSRSDVGGLEEEPRARIRERMLGDTCAGWCEATWPPWRNLLKGKSNEDGAGAAGDYIDPVEL